MDPTTTSPALHHPIYSFPAPIPASSSRCHDPPPPYLTPLHCPTRHALSLLLSLTFTLSLHPDLLTLLLYWTTRSLRLLTPPTQLPLFPDFLAPPCNGTRSRYWATLHTLRWEVGRNRRAVRAGLWGYGVVFVTLAWVPREAGENVVGAVWPFLAAVGEVYLHLLVSCTAVRVGVWGVRVALGFAGAAVVEAGREVLLFWDWFFGEYWRLLLAVVMCCASLSAVVRADLKEIWEGTGGWVLLSGATHFYQVGDTLRDTAALGQMVYY
jgi:hypothetical protein